MQNCPSKPYHPAANRALPAVIFGVIGEVGQIGGQRLACPLVFKRVHPKDPGESRLWQDLLRWFRRHLAAEHVAGMDAGVKLGDVQAAGLERYLLRLATNFTARRNRPLPYGAKAANLSMARRSARFSAATRAKPSQPASPTGWKPGPKMAWPCEPRSGKT